MNSTSIGQVGLKKRLTEHEDGDDEGLEELQRRGVEGATHVELVAALSSFSSQTRDFILMSTSMTISNGITLLDKIVQPICLCDHVQM